MTINFQDLERGGRRSLPEFEQNQNKINVQTLKKIFKIGDQGGKGGWNTRKHRKNRRAQFPTLVKFFFFFFSQKKGKKIVGKKNLVDKIIHSNYN